MSSPAVAVPGDDLADSAPDDGTSERSDASSPSGQAGNSHPLLRYGLRRVGLYLVELWGALTVAFFFFRLMPGDPVRTLLQQIQQQYSSNSVQANAEVLQRYRTEFGLDGNLFEQYLRYLKNLVLHQNLGPSLISYPTPASEVVARSLPWTIGLMGTTAVLSWVIGVAAGAVVGWYRGRRGAEAMTTVSIALSQVPFYFVALVLVYVFAYQFAVLPDRAAYDSQITPGWSPAFIGSVLEHATLPALSMVLIGMLAWLLSTRMLMVPVLGEDFLLYAEAKGLKPREVLVKYALRNCYLPQVTAFGIGLGFIFNGNVLVEQLFSYPGLGSTLITAINQLDFNTILAVTDMSIFGVLTANLLLDLVLPLLDPRVKYWK